jgi:hypothetical protein
MKVLHKKNDTNYTSITDPSYSFIIYYDDKSEFHCRRILENSDPVDIKKFRGDVYIDIEDSIITISVRYTRFRELFDAFLNNAIVIKYHGYTVIPDINSLTLTDHRNGYDGTDKIFTRIKFKARFDFQEN